MRAPEANGVVIITNIPRPYRRALFAHLAILLGEAGFRLTVLYSSNPSAHLRRGVQTADHSGDYEERFLETYSYRRGYEKVFSVPKRLGATLRGLRPACVVAAGFDAAAWTASHWCHSSKVPYVMWSGAWPGQEGDLGELQTKLRRKLVRRADAFVTYGSAAADYLHTLGAPRERIYPAWNTVDLEAMAGAAGTARSQVAAMSAKYGLARKNLLFVGSLVERKGLRELVSAGLRANPDDSDWALHLCGDGPLREELEATARAGGRESNFRFHGLCPETDIPELLAFSDGFVLPTLREAWGLVINEAMACGVPVIASPLAGATQDLIDHGATGYVVDPRDTPALAAALTRLLSDDEDCKRVGRAGAQAVREKASLDNAAAGIVAAVRCAMGSRPHG